MTSPDNTTPPDSQPSTDLDEVALSRRRFLRNAALTGGGLVAAAGLAACAPAAGQASTSAPALSSGSAAPGAGGSAVPSAAPTASAAATMSMEPAPSASASAAGLRRAPADRLDRSRRRRT